MSKILLLAESGSDLTAELAAKHNITIVPMHVSYGGETRDDGSFPVTEMFDYYARTHELPRTSGCTPHDFETAYDRLQKEYPDAQNLDREKPLYLIFGAGLDEAVKRNVERIVTEKGYKEYHWVQTGCVIAAHSGPGAFGIAGFTK